MGKGRRPCCDKAGVKKGPWSQAEDFKLISFIQKHGHNNWRALPKLAGLARCGKSCRLRWVNYLRPDLKRGEFTPHEEETIIKLHEELGNKWSKIASHFPGRTDNEIKNVWNTHLKKRLKAKVCQGKSTESSCNTLSASALSTSNEPLEESKNLDCPRNTPTKHQTITIDKNNDTTEYSSSSSTSYNSKPSFSDHQISDDLNANPLTNVSDHKDATSGCTNKKGENLLDELIEIPFEPNLDLWDLLHGDSEVQFQDIIDTPMFENDLKNENTTPMQDGGSWWWLVYLENELGLESTLPQSTKATSTLDFFSDISI